MESLRIELEMSSPEIWDLAADENFKVDGQAMKEVPKIEVMKQIKASSEVKTQT